MSYYYILILSTFLVSNNVCNKLCDINYIYISDTY